MTLNILPEIRSMACSRKGECGNVFPSRWMDTDCDGDGGRGSCEVGMLCCNPGETIRCDSEETFTHDGTNCPAGSMKTNAWRVCSSLDEDGRCIFTYRLTCRRECSCVAPCSNTPPQSPQLVGPAPSDVVLGSGEMTLEWEALIGSQWGANCAGNTATRQIKGWRSVRCSLLSQGWL
jgi:hypothetical protein